MKASDLFVRALENEGVEFVFGIPGEETLDFLESLSQSDIKMVVTRHEQAAGFMAATLGRLTGEVGVCLATLGPGATNAVTAAAYAQLGGMPMFLITGQKPIKSSRQGLFQLIDVVDLMNPVTKYSRQLTNSSSIPARVREAFRAALEEKPGATHLELPEDIAQEETEKSPVAKSRVRRPVADETAVELAADLLLQAKHPLILIGAGANRTRTAQALRKFIDGTGIPFITTQMGKGVVDERHSRFMGNAAMSEGDFPHRVVECADVILNVGHDAVEKPPFFMEPDGQQVVHIAYSSAKVDPVYFPQLEIVGDIADSINRLQKSLCRDGNDWEFTRFFTIKKALDEHLQDGVEDDRFPMYPQRIVADVRRVMPEQGIVTLDNGIYKLWFARNYRAHCPNTVLLDNALASMGAGLPSAIAAKLVRPDQRVMAVCGDGGFLMNSQELETAVRLDLDLVVLILNDGAYGMIRWKQAAMGFSYYGLSFSNPDIVAYARSYGAHGHRIERASELISKVEFCLGQPGVHVIDVPVDYSDNGRVLNEEIPRISGAL